MLLKIELFSQFIVNVLPLAADSLNFISMVKCLPFFFHLLPFFPSLDPEYDELVADVPSDRESAGPWHGKRDYVSNAGNKDGCGVWLQTVGTGIGVGRRKEGFKTLFSRAG